MVSKDRFNRSLWWGILLLVLVFSCGRAHYFVPSAPRYHFFSRASDAAWHWCYQSSLANRTSFRNDVYQKLADELRFPVDRFINRLIIWLSQKLSFPRLTLNFLLSSTIYLLTFLFIYLLGLKVIREPKWAFFFGLLVSQSMYVSWLRYPVFVPKMLGFMMYPLVWYALVKLKEHPQKYWLFILVGMIAFILYPVSTIYYFPLLLLIGFLGIIRGKTWDWHLVGGYLIAIVILSCTMFLFLYPRPLLHPPPLNMMEYYSKNFFFFPKTFFGYLQSYGDYFLLSVVSLLFLLKKGEDNDKEIATFLFGAFAGCVLIGVATHIMAVSIPKIKMLQFWKLAYYSYIPGLLLIVMACRLWNLKLFKKSTFSKIIASLLPVILLLYVVYRTPGQADTLKGTLKTITALRQGVIDDKYGREMSGLVEFAKATPPYSTFFLPHKNYQRAKFNLFMADSGRRCFSYYHQDKWLLVIEVRGLTQRYYEFLQDYDEIEALQDEREFNKRLIHLANRTDACYIIHPQKHRFRLSLPCVYEDSFWLVYSLR